METQSQLMGVIQKMQAEITRLERENQALRKKLTTGIQGRQGTEDDSEGGKEKECTSLEALGKACGQFPASPPAGAPALQKHQDEVMIIRRYSVSPPFRSSAAKDPWKAGKLSANGDVLEAWGTVRAPLCSSTKNQDSEETVLAAKSLSSTSCSKTVSPEHGFARRNDGQSVTVD